MIVGAIWDSGQGEKTTHSAGNIRKSKTSWIWTLLKMLECVCKSAWIQSCNWCVDANAIINKNTAFITSYLTQYFLLHIPPDI